jgi:hypothetical protein
MTGLLMLTIAPDGAPWFQAFGVNLPTSTGTA